MSSASSRSTKNVHQIGERHAAADVALETLTASGAISR
jgi:hypothetical protein